MPTIDPAVSLLLTLTLAAIFAWSGATKLADIELFSGAVANYRLLPRAVERSFGWCVPLCECSCALGLCFSALRTPAAFGAMLLLCVFTGAIAINLIRGRHIDCGCFGPLLRQDLSVGLLVRNAVLIVLAAMVALPAGTRSLAWLDYLTIGMGAATAVLLYASANYALGNAPRTDALEAF